MLSVSARLTRELRPRETALTGWESNQMQDMAALLFPGFKGLAGPKALELMSYPQQGSNMVAKVSWHLDLSVKEAFRDRGL